MLKKLLAVLVLTVLSAYAQTPVVGGEGGGGGTWGSITGTLADQTDLQSALDAKLESADVDGAIQDSTPLKCTDAGSNDTYTCTMSPVPASAAAAPLLWFDPNTSNTGAATLDIGPGSALPIYQNFDGVDPDDDDLQANTPLLLRYCASCNSAAGAWVYDDLAGASKNIQAGGACPADGLPILGPDGITSCIPASLAALEWFIANPTVGATSSQQKALPNFAANTVTSVDCICIAAGACTVDLNFDARDKTTPTVAGTDLHTSEIVADEDNTTVTSFAGDTTAALNEKWNLSISAVTGSPTLLQCYMNVEVD